MEAEALFENTIEWLRKHYSQFKFFVERDLVWTVQTKIIKQIDTLNLPYKIFNDYPIAPGTRRSLSTDLAIVDNYGSIIVAVEFKYEPSHKRKDIIPSKFPVVFWGDDGVGKDVARIRDFVQEGKSKVGFSIFIDEGGHFRHRPPHPGSSWIDWSPNDSSIYYVSALWSRVDFTI